MLSRAALLTAAKRPAAVVLARGSASATDANRPVRADQPGKVRLGFIPDEWFTFFYPKTGVTGPYVFGAGMLTYLCSKEIYVMEHEYYNGLSLAIMVIYAVKKFGPAVAAYCDKEIDRIEGEWKQGREDNIAQLNQAIEDEKKEQWRAEGPDAADAGQEGERPPAAGGRVERQNVDRRISQKHMVDWIVSNVVKSITPDQEKETLNKCIADLGAIAARSK
ncbi:hypothetical protein quinque_015827 [Culex quinquefasciatus]